MENHVVFLELPKTRVYLRPVEKTDLPFFIRSLNNENIAKFLQSHRMMMEIEEEEWFQNLPKKKDENRVCSIALRATHEVIGTIGLHGINWINRTAVSGIFLAEEFWGKGLGREVDMLWLKYAFFTLNLRQVYASVYDFNSRSQGNLMKSGYKEVARYPEYVFKNGKYCDVLHFLITREIWEPLWQEFEKKYV